MFIVTEYAALSDKRSWKPIFGLLFEWPLKTGFTVLSRNVDQKSIETVFLNAFRNAIENTISIDF